MSCRVCHYERKGYRLEDGVLYRDANRRPHEHHRLERPYPAWAVQQEYYDHHRDQIQVIQINDHRARIRYRISREDFERYMLHIEFGEHGAQLKVYLGRWASIPFDGVQRRLF